MKIIAISNQKGGIGKTTTATNLAYGLRILGKSVLLVDCDPQRNSSDTYRADLSDGAPTLADFLYSDEPATECIQHTEFGDIIAADRLLEDADKYLKGVSGFYRLKKRLSEIEGNYDHIILDTPPALNLLLQNALIAAEGVIVPVLCDRYSLQGMSDFYDTVKDVRAQPNPGLEILGLLLVKYEKRTVLSRDIEAGLSDVVEKLGTTVFSTRIRETVNVREAQTLSSPVLAYNRDCTASTDYMNLIAELNGRGIV